MIWFALGRWFSRSGRFFISERIYVKSKWTPFIKVSWRYTYSRLFTIITDIENDVNNIIRENKEWIQRVENKQTNILNQMLDFDNRLKKFEDCEDKKIVKKTKPKRSYTKRIRRNNENN